MPIHCQECNSHFLLDGTTVAQGISCPDCGGTRLERDQPSPTHSDGELRDMVDPATQLDQGGNPLQEGVWANIDGGWQPSYKRDEFFAKMAGQIPPPSGIEPQHHDTVVPSERAGLHNQNLFWLAFLDASVNGKPVRGNESEIWAEHGFPGQNSFGQPVTISVHHPEHMAAAKEVAQHPSPGMGGPALKQNCPTMHALGAAIMTGQVPPPPGINVRPQAPPPVMSNHSYERSISQEPYLPWFHEAAPITRYPAGGGAPEEVSIEDWAQQKRERYKNQQAVSGHRLNWQPGQAGRGIMIGHQLHTWPVERTMDNPQGGDMHGEYVQKLGVNPANIDVKTGFEINPDGSVVGANIPPAAFQIEPNLRDTEGFEGMFGSHREGVAFLGPLAVAGGRALLQGAIGGLMRRAIMGQGNFLQMGQADEYEGQPGMNRGVGLVASEHTAVGVKAPVETPGSVPDMVEDHDPEAVDQQEFNDGDTSPAFNNPNNDNAEGGLSQSQGEDGMHQKLEFRHDGEGVGQAELLLPLIMEYVHSDKSAMENPQLKALHETLEREIPNYLDLADEEDDAVHKLLEQLKDPKGVEAKVGAPVYQNTPMNPNQMAMGPQQMAMPGTHQNPVGPGGMSVTGKCMNCGGVTNADGSCPQCGASPGANQMGNMGQPGQQAPLGIMPSPYAKTAELIPHPPLNTQGLPPGYESLKCADCGETFTAHQDEYVSCPNCHSEVLHVIGRTAADHQGPITPQQKEVFSEYLIEQGRQDEVAAMMANPGLYADEWAEYLNRSTQPPEVDPAEQVPPPQMDPSQMGQMPVPGMSVPPGGGMGGGQMMAKTALSDRRCPKCESATTNIINGDGDMRCHRCGNVWKMDLLEDTPAIKSHWVIKSYQDALNDAPNPVAAPAAEATAPGDREQQTDSTLTWQDASGQPLQVGQVYEMHNPGYAIPDVIKIQAVKPDSITVTMEGEYNAPSDPQDANGPGYTHEIDINELQTEGLTFNPVQGGEGEEEQSQDQADQDGIGQTVNTEPVEQPHGEFPLHAKTLPTDHCPKCQYQHVTSSYVNPELVQYDCFRCAHVWQVEDKDPGVEGDLESRAWLNESSVQDDIGFDPRALAMAQTGSRNIQDIAQNDPRNALLRQKANEAKAEREKTAGAKFSPREQKEFIDEDGVARNADLLNLDGTHYVSAFDNSKARPDRVNENYLGLGL